MGCEYQYKCVVCKGAYWSRWEMEPEDGTCDQVCGWELIRSLKHRLALAMKVVEAARPLLDGFDKDGSGEYRQALRAFDSTANSASHGDTSGSDGTEGKSNDA